MCQLEGLTDNNKYWLIQYTDTADGDDLTVTKTLDGCIDAACLAIRDRDIRVNFDRNDVVRPSTTNKVDEVIWIKSNRAIEKRRDNKISKDKLQDIKQDLRELGDNTRMFFQHARNPLHHINMDHLSHLRRMKAYLKKGSNKQKMSDPRVFFKTFEKVMKSLDRSSDYQLKYKRPIWSKLVDVELLCEVTVFMNHLKKRMDPDEEDETIPSLETKQTLKRLLLIIGYFISKEGRKEAIKTIAGHFADLYLQSDGQLAWICIAQDMQNRFEEGNRSLTQRICNEIEIRLKKSPVYNKEQRQKLVDDLWQLVEGRKPQRKRNRKRKRSEVATRKGSVAGAGEPPLKRQRKST